MKQGWEIKKLGEVCEVIGGSTPKTSDDTFWDGDYYWISPAELDGSKYVYSTTRTITDAGVRSAHLQILPIGTVLLSSRAPIGKVAITKVPMYCNQGFKNLVCGKDLINEYVYWFLKHNTDYLNSLGTGATFKEISKKVVEQIPIPVPPIAEQEKIVAELDCLSGIIEKKKQQLKELDNLAQSIFYEMFGDPVENDKGWDVKKLGEVCDVRDGTHDSPKYLEHSEYVLVTSKNITSDGDIDFTTANYISKEDYDAINKRSYVDFGDIIMAMIGTIGKPIIVKETSRKFCIKNVALIKFEESTSVTNTYIQALLSNNSYASYIQGNNKGGTQKFIALGTIRKLLTPIPPLTIQQDFASKIESIEKQKELIAQSIKETETLFNSRMDYYFN